MKRLKMLTTRNQLSVFFISWFTVSVTPSINSPFISSLKMNKVNPFPAMIVHFPFIYLLTLFFAFEAKLLTNPGKLSLAKGIAIFL